MSRNKGKAAMSLIMPQKSIIPACDVATLADLADVVEATACLDGIGAYKIDGPGSCVLVEGLGHVAEVVRKITDKPVIYDHQKAGNDIPDMSKPFAQALLRAHVDAAILFPFAGPKTEEAWIVELLGVGITPIIGAEMTHRMFVASEGGWINDYAFDLIFVLAAELGVRDFVVPGNKPERVAHYHELLTRLCGDNPFALYAPGFVAQGGKIGDCAKVAGDHWHAIVGRGIYEADDMFAAAEEYCGALSGEGG
jgi:orotidine-5'-phosphate decarboxylase